MLVDPASGLALHHQPQHPPRQLRRINPPVPPFAGSSVPLHQQRRPLATMLAPQPLPGNAQGNAFPELPHQDLGREYHHPLAPAAGGYLEVVADQVGYGLV